jgi:ankyrin repeat protein
MSAPAKAQITSPIPHLWQIAAGGDIDQLQDLLDRGADVNASNPSGLTPLMVAAYHGRIEMVRALIKNGADVNATDDEGLTAAMLADDAGHDEIVRILVGRAVKRKKTAPAPETSQPQSTVDETFEAAAEFDAPEPRASAVRTLQEPPDIWDMVHETRTEFNPGSVFFGRVGLRHSVIGAGILLIVAGVSALCFITLRRSSSGDATATPAQTRSNNTNIDLRTARSTANKPVQDQRSVSKNARTAMAIRSVFDPKTIVAGAVGMREAALVAPRAASLTSEARPSVALFHADDKKRTQKFNPHVGNSGTGAALENRDRSQLPGSSSDNDKRTNSAAARKEIGKLPAVESSGPPKPHPTPKGKVIQWPQ